MDKVNEAVIVLARCGEAHKTYGVRIEKTGKDQWRETWAFPINDSAAKREGYDKTTIKGNIVIAPEYPGCPYCGGKGWTVCSCGHLSCTILRDGIFTCEWCGSKGQIGEYAGEGIKAGMDL